MKKKEPIANNHWVSRVRLVWVTLLAIVTLVYPLYAQESLENIQQRNDQISQQAIQILQTLEVVEDNGVPRVKVGLNDFVEYYLAVNSGTIQADYGVLASKEIAQIASGIFTPELALSANFNRSQPVFRGDASAISTQDQTYKIGLSTLTPWGIRAGMSYERSKAENSALFNFQDYDLSEFDIEKTGDFYLNSLNLELQVPIFQDFGSPVTVQAEKAKLNYAQSLNSHKTAINNLAKTLVSLYWDLSALLRQIAALRVRADLSQSLLAEIRQKVTLGLLPNTALLEQEAQALLDQTNLEQAQNRLLTVEETVKSALKVPDLPYGILPDEEYVERSIEKSDEEVSAEILQFSPDLTNLEHEKKKKQLDLLASENKNRPNVDLNVLYSIRGYSSTDPDAKLINDGRINTFQTALTWKIPLGYNSAHSQMLADQYLLAQQSERESDFRSTLLTNVRANLRNLQASSQFVFAYQKQVQLRNDLLNKELIRFKQGLSTVNQISEAQLRLFQSEQALISAQSNYQKYFYGIQIDRGKLYEYFPRLQELLINPGNE